MFVTVSYAWHVVSARAAEPLSEAIIFAANALSCSHCKKINSSRVRPDRSRRLPSASTTVASGEDGKIVNSGETLFTQSSSPAVTSAPSRHLDRVIIKSSSKSDSEPTSFPWELRCRCVRSASSFVRATKSMFSSQSQELTGRNSLTGKEKRIIFRIQVIYTARRASILSDSATSLAQMT